ncbi:protein WEAK CHLOROPLAST MOVEMENT UNDER BLUE LIGHT 1-like [Oryza brachyantha]|nr:protein WEAK CHLOROPLAST MOVEMENT UNDER BLUE LIGHT 1-like [Oryza brachyantha]XP_015696586.1 protein WEAK CHLOROPLAST MOVEMENT UNDER BLUE LIGHT 1-like [Oryza brachyantha]
MEGLNVEGITQVTVDPNFVDVLSSSHESKTTYSSNFPSSFSIGHKRHSSEDLSSLTINNLRLNDGEENHHNHFEENIKYRHGHTRRFSEDLSSLTINDLCANKVDKNCDKQLEKKEIYRHNSAGNIFKAAEIAERFIQTIDNRVLVDTRAPIESVKDAVSKFGGILDWKERRKHVQIELDKMQQDATEYQIKIEATRVQKSKVLEELRGTRRIIEGLRIDLDNAQVEAMQAQQNLELVEIQFKEIQQGIAHKENGILKEEIGLVDERRASVLTDLQSVKMELDQLQKEYTSLVSQRDITEKKACESFVASQEIEKIVEDLTIKIINMKESLASFQAAHIIAEEQKRNVALTYQHDRLNWHNELNQLDDEVQKLNDDLSVNKDLESKLQAASVLLMNLRDEFMAYVEGTLPEVPSDNKEKECPMVLLRMKLAQTRKELEDMRIDIGRAKNEVKSLWNVAATLRADVENEKTNLAVLRQKENLAFVSALSLQEELNKIAFDLSTVEERTKAAKIPLELQQASKKLEHAKKNVMFARNEMKKAREEADQAQAEINVVQLRIEATSREILAVNASREIAVASANALEDYKDEVELESQVARRNKTITLSIEEYNILCKKVQDAEDLAKKRVIRAVDKIKEAKEAEVRSLDRLDQLIKQIDDRRIALRDAHEKANVAHDGKLAMENELRKRRAQHEKQRKASEASLPIGQIFSLKNTSTSFDAIGSSTSDPHKYQLLPRADTIGTTTMTESRPRKSFFPRSLVAMFMFRRKTHLK